MRSLLAKEPTKCWWHLSGNISNELWLKCAIRSLVILLLFLSTDGIIFCFDIVLKRRRRRRKSEGKNLFPSLPFPSFSSPSLWCSSKPTIDSFLFSTEQCNQSTVDSGRVSWSRRYVLIEGQLSSSTSAYENWETRTRNEKTRLERNQHLITVAFVSIWLEHLFINDADEPTRCTSE